MSVDKVADSSSDWAVIKSVMEAQTNTSMALEQYLLYVTHDDFDLDADHVEQCLAQAIDHHERAIEDLQLARSIVADDN